jgi:hypothetical protein
MCTVVWSEIVSFVGAAAGLVLLVGGVAVVGLAGVLGVAAAAGVLLGGTTTSGV